MNKIKTVDQYIEKQQYWQDILQILRDIITSTQLEETIKWGAPTYTFNGKNVVGIGAFKSYAGLWFFNGALLKDEYNKLINAQEGKTVGMRQWRFTSADEIEPQLVLKYIEEAIDNEKNGRIIEKVRSTQLITSDELLHALNCNAELSSAFSALTPYKQKEYHEYINEAKREATRLSRIEKIIPMILQGLGLSDKYR